MPCRLIKGLELVCLVCEIGAVVCTLVYLFNLKHSSSASSSSMGADETEKQISSTFVSVAITIVTATVKAVGVSKVVGAVRSAAVSIRPSMTSIVAPALIVAAHSSTVRPSFQHEEAKDQNRDAEDGVVATVTDMPSTMDQGQDGDVAQSTVRRPSVAGQRPGSASGS